MTDKEKTALAMLSSGASFKEASVLTGIDVNRLMELWRETRKTAA
ncbi:hypothetical protein phi3LM21_p50 [Sinorhizobium phage phi3LM21]|nr:hypothetical protein phi3LM21_p50 [Sinorhizobium phage phi3LM21]